MIFHQWLSLVLFLIYCLGILVFVKENKEGEWNSIVWFYSLYLLTLPLFELRLLFPRKLIFQVIESLIQLLLLYQIYRVTISLSGFFSRISTLIYFILLGVSFLVRVLQFIPITLSGEGILNMNWIRNSMGGFYINSLIFLLLLVIGFRAAKIMEKQSSSTSSYLLIWLSLTLVLLEVGSLYSLDLLNYPPDFVLMLISLGVCIYLERLIVLHRRRKEEFNQ